MTVPARSQLTSGGRFVRPTEKKPGADVSRSDSSTTTTPVFGIEDALQLDAQLAISAIGSGATLTVKLQVSQDGTTWQDAPGGGFGAQTATTTGINISASTPGVFGRWSVTIAQGSTPSPIAYSIDSQAVVHG